MSQIHPEIKQISKSSFLSSGPSPPTSPPLLFCLRPPSRDLVSVRIPAFPLTALIYSVTLGESLTHSSTQRKQSRLGLGNKTDFQDFHLSALGLVWERKTKTGADGREFLQFKVAQALLTAH